MTDTTLPCVHPPYPALCTPPYTALCTPTLPARRSPLYMVRARSRCLEDMLWARVVNRARVVLPRAGLADYSVQKKGGFSPGKTGSLKTESGINWIEPGSLRRQEPMFWIPSEKAGFLKKVKNRHYLSLSDQNRHFAHSTLPWSTFAAAIDQS